MNYLLLIPGVLVLLVLIAVVRTLLSPKKTSDYKPQEDEQEALRLPHAAFLTPSDSICTF